MNEWLKDEVAALESAERKRQEDQKRLDLVRQHTYRVWEQLKHLIQDAAEQMNQMPEMKSYV
jgi:acyl-CoA-binding protein